MEALTKVMIIILSIAGAGLVGSLIAFGVICIVDHVKAKYPSYKVRVVDMKPNGREYRRPRYEQTFKADEEIKAVKYYDERVVGLNKFPPKKNTVLVMLYKNNKIDSMIEVKPNGKQEI